MKWFRLMVVLVDDGVGEGWLYISSNGLGEL